MSHLKSQTDLRLKFVVKGQSLPLILQSNQITDVSNLINLTNLRTLYLQYNQLTDIAVLNALTQATNINLYANDDLQCNQISALEQILGTGVVTGPRTCVPSQLITDNYFPDPNLRACVLAKASEQGWTMLNEVTLLSCFNKSIVDLTGLEKLTELTFLSVGANQINDISPVSSLTKLVTLGASYNQISDVSAFNQSKFIRNCRYR